MYHTKSKHDYMNRYQRSGERDMFQTPLGYNQTMAQSSSSTDTSPESFPDLGPHQFPPEFRFEGAKRPELHIDRTPDKNKQDFQDIFRQDVYQAQMRPEHTFENRYNTQIPEYRSSFPEITNFVPTEVIKDTPLIARRQRPIMGRKIMTNEPLMTIEEFPWQNMAQTPPKSLEQKYSQSYELFPSENRGFEFPSPVKSSPHTSPQLGTPPRIPMTPRTSTPVTPPPKSPFSPRMSTPFKEPLIGLNASFASNYGSTKMCMFCKKNGETPLVYMTHTVKEKVGNKNVVTCPILRSHICSMCGASGDNAHTITYCPVMRNGNNGQPLQSTTITLKNTRIKSNGRRRY